MSNLRQDHRRRTSFLLTIGIVVLGLVPMVWLFSYVLQSSSSKPIIVKLDPIPMPDLESLSPERRGRFEAVQGAIRHAWKSYAERNLGFYNYPTKSKDAKEPSLSFRTRSNGTSNEQNIEPVVRNSFLARHIPADDWSPISQQGHDWLFYAATLHDTLDTLYLAGLKDEFDFVVENCLSTDIQTTSLRPTKTFEYSLRIVGGLLGAYSVSGDSRLLQRAQAATDALLASPFHSSPTPLPRMYDVLFPQSGFSLYQLYARLYQWGRDVFTNEHRYNSLAGIGSFALEFYFLSQTVNDDKYRQAADAIFEHILKHQQADGSIPTMWNVVTGKPTSSHSSLGSGSDSFYEYLLKVPLWEGCELEGPHKWACPRLEDSSKKLVNEMLAAYEKVLHGALPTKHVVFKEDLLARRNKSMNSRPRDNTLKKADVDVVAYPVEAGDVFHHLLCFLPGLVALGASKATQPNHRNENLQSSMELAKVLVEGCNEMYTTTATGIGPEELSMHRWLEESERDFQGFQSGGGGTDTSYFLRPEFLESVFVLYRLTGDTKYQEMGWTVFERIEKHCRTEFGYSGLSNVFLLPSNNEYRVDDMPSYFLAETLKYLLLLFGPDNYVSLDDFVFTTEAHPLRRRAELVLNKSSGIVSKYTAGASIPIAWHLWSLVLLTAVLLVAVAVSSSALGGSIDVSRLRSKHPPLKKQ